MFYIIAGRTSSKIYNFVAFHHVCVSGKAWNPQPYFISLRFFCGWRECRTWSSKWGTRKSSNNSKNCVSRIMYFNLEWYYSGHSVAQHQEKVQKNTNDEHVIIIIIISMNVWWSGLCAWVIFRFFYFFLHVFQVKRHCRSWDAKAFCGVYAIRPVIMWSINRKRVILHEGTTQKQRRKRCALVDKL